MNDNISFEDRSSYGEEKTTFKDIILRHLRKISDIQSKEMVEGYWEKKPFSTAGGVSFVKVYHEDLRLSYINAINFLIDVITPLGDKDFKAYIATNEKVDADESDIPKTLISKRKTFKQINEMFSRSDFFGGTDSSDEGG